MQEPPSIKSTIMLLPLMIILGMRVLRVSLQQWLDMAGKYIWL